MLLTNSLHIYWALSVCKVLCLVLRLQIWDMPPAFRNLFFYYFIYLFMTDRQRDTGRGRSRLGAGDPGSPGSHPGLKAALNLWATGAALPSVILKPNRMLSLWLYVPPYLVGRRWLVSPDLLVMSSNAFLFTSVPLHCAQWLAHNNYSINICWSDFLSKKESIIIGFPAVIDKLFEGRDPCL